MSDIFLRTRLFADTVLADETCWSLSIDVKTAAQLDDVLLAALTTSGLRGTYQAEGIDEHISLDSPMRVTFDLDLDDEEYLELAELTRIELLTFLSTTGTEVIGSQLHRPQVQAWAE